MIKYFQTTTLILLWCGLLSFLWAWLCFEITSFRRQRKVDRRSFAVLPTLVLGPVILLGAFKVFGVNLLYPVHLFSDFGTLIRSAFFPAIILCFASGLVFSIHRSVTFEYGFWSEKSFLRMTEACGLSVRRSLRKLVITKSLTHAWSQSLPWLFGELIVVEAVFNAPGLGLEAWHQARTRDLNGLMTTVIAMIGMYFMAVIISRIVNKWLGQKLESYV